MLLLASLYAAAILASRTCATPSTAPADPICIVGAGPGGLTIAHELEQKGLPTVVFDKQAKVGGKCQSIYDGPDESFYHPMGALIFTNLTWVNTLPLIEASGLPVTPGPLLSDSLFYGAGDAASTVGPRPPTTDAQKAIIAAELEQYIAFWTSDFAPSLTAPRYVNGVPEDLTMPMADWLSSQGFVALPQIIEIAMAPYGYGNITETPAVYMLQYLTPDVLGSFLGVTTTNEVDFHKVMVDYAATLKGPVHVNAAVTAIDRSGDVPIVTYTSGFARRTQRCAKVVLAFPPTLESLQAIKMPLSTEEKEVFSKVQITAYWSSAVDTKVTALSAFLQTPFEELGAPVSFIRTFNESPITTVWSWGAIGSNPPLSKVTELLVKTISEVQVGLGIASPEVSIGDVRAIQKQEYFPHFGESDLADGIYTKYNALQGQQNTYYSSGLNSFELVEFAIRAGKELVATFF